MFFGFLFVLLTYLVIDADSGSVLFIPALMSASHKIALSNWADALADRGHQVYWWAPAAKTDSYQPKKAAYVDHFKVEVEDSNLMSAFVHENVTEIFENLWTDNYPLPFLETQFNYMLIPFCESIVKSHKKSLDKILSMKYDFVIIDEFFNNCGLIVSQLIGSPVGVYVSTCRMSTTAYRFNDVPISSAYVSTMGDLSVLSDQMNIWQRLQSTLSWWLADSGNFVLFRLMNNKIKKTFPNIEDIRKSLIRPDFQFICVNQQLEFSGPIPQNLIYIGGIQLAAVVEPLSDEWQSFVDSSKNGFILLAMGHWARWKHAPVQWKEAFLEAFKRVPKDYSIIWQYDDVPIENLPKNIKLSKWLPQRSLLADPNCKLFITHAGCNGLTEALYHAVPMVAIPLMADQPDGAARVAKKGLGVLLKKYDITADSLLKSIMAVLKNESYGINIRKLADNLKSDAMSPVEKAVFWSEFAMRHQGGSYYKSSLEPTSFDWLKYYCIDFIIYFCIIFFLFIRFMKNVALFIVSKLTRDSNGSKQKTE